MFYRNQQGAREEYAGKRNRMIRGMISRREVYVPESNGMVVTLLGRQAADGSFEEDRADALSPPGFVANPHEYSTVEAICNFVGADGDHPVCAGMLDHRRYEIVDKVGLQHDETLIYTTKAIVKIKVDGTVEIRSVDGTAAPLAFKSDVDALQTRVDALEQALLTHVHVTGLPTAPTSTPVQPYVGTVPPAVPLPLVPTTPAVISGTSKLKAE
jgi:hypothetical protein